LALDSAEKSQEFFASADGTRIGYRAWPLPGARITFAVVHGLGEHSGRYDRFAKGMAKHGMATYALDLRGHGTSDGRRGHVDRWGQWVEDAAAFIQQVESQEASGEVVPLGHSFGGVVVLSAAIAGRLSKANRFVLSSPALRLANKVPPWQSRLVSVLSNVAPRLAVNNQVDAGTISRIPEMVGAYKSDPLVHSKITTRLFHEWEKAAQEDLVHATEITTPFLILAGTADRLIDPQGSVELHEKTSKVSDLHLLEGRYHEPFNDLGSDEVFKIIADWVRKQ
jgi:alpha-beta hydrolase superfamily lysophospholipase